MRPTVCFGRFPINMNGHRMVRYPLGWAECDRRMKCRVGGKTALVLRHLQILVRGRTQRCVKHSSSLHCHLLDLFDFQVVEHKTMSAENRPSPILCASLFDFIGMHSEP